MHYLSYKMPNVVLQAAVLLLTLRIATGCGGSLFGSGNITSPNFPNLYPSNLRCMWTLFANPGQYVSLLMLHQDLDSYDYVYVFNEAVTMETTQCSYVDRFSGTFLDSIWNTNTMVLGQNATVMFFSDSYVSRTGFRMEYRSVKKTFYTDCGGNLVGSGTISSPNYPNFYPKNSRCIWTLTAHPGEHISLRLQDFTSYHSLYIYNGTSTSTEPSSCELLHQFMGLYFYNSDARRSKVLAIGPSVTVVFFSNDFFSSSVGFQLEYASGNIITYEECGSHLSGSGVITSPNYPSPYPINTRCTWTLTANPGEVISLLLVDLHTEPWYDYVYISNGITAVKSSQLYSVRRYSGDIIAYGTEMFVIGPSATVVFFSDSSISHSGFQLKFTSFNAASFTECGGNLVGSGNITSPNYPNYYPANARCTWTISASDGHYILLRIISFDTELSDYVYYGSDDPYCDSTNCYKGQYRYIGGYNGVAKPLSVGTSVTISFESGSFDSASGFKIEYTTLNTTFTDCGGYFVGSGNITSPNYPSFYPENSRCTWTLSAPAGFAILLSIIIVDTEPGIDFVYYEYNNESAYGSSYQNNYFSGSRNYSNYDYKHFQPLVLLPNVTVVFTSDSSISASGFYIEYTTIKQFADCGGFLFGSGNITSPNYPQFYPNNSHCTWRFTASSGYLISLRIMDFYTEPSADRLYIYNGSAPVDYYENNYFSSYSGQYSRNHWRKNTKPLVLGPNVEIVFVSDSSISASGFRIEYATVNATQCTVADCGGDLVGSGNITSPNYPNFYPANCICTWTLSASPGLFVSLRLINFDTENSYDYVRIYNCTRIGDPYQHNYISYSGLGNPSWNYNWTFQPLIMGPSVCVEFISDYSISASGFEIEYTSVANPLSADTAVVPCGDDVYGSGVISSPNFPLPYPNNAFCQWNLSSYPVNYVLIVQFRVFKTEVNYDVVRIYSEDGTMRQYSGSSLPPKSVIGSRGQVVFTSDNSSSASGFYMTYTSADISGTDITAGQQSRSVIIDFPSVIVPVMLASAQLFIYRCVCG